MARSFDSYEIFLPHISTRLGPHLLRCPRGLVRAPILSARDEHGRDLDLLVRGELQVLKPAWVRDAAIRVKRALEPARSILCNVRREFIIWKPFGLSDLLCRRVRTGRQPLALFSRAA